MKIDFSIDEKFKIEVDQLKQAYISLPLYVSHHFSELRNKVDISCQTFLIGLDNDLLLSSEASRQALKNQALIIEEIMKFEKACLENLDEITDDLDEEASFLIQSVEIDKNNNTLKYHCLISACILKIQRLLFLNKTLVFLDKNSTLIGDAANLPVLKSFGILILVEDTFIGESGFHKR